MASYESFFAGKRVTLLGLGVLGRGVGDAEFLAQCGAILTITDRKDENELAESMKRLKKYPNITFHLGGHKREDFENADMVIKAAGVPLDSHEIAAARAAGVSVYMSTALFAKFAAEADAIVVGVTGTRGKSTVAHMIYHSLIRANKRTMLGGNVRGISTLAMLPEIQAGDIAVLELDSWQLQGFGDLEISPDVAVFTNLLSDHLIYYGGDTQKYFADKANIFSFQKSNGVLLAGASAADRIRAVHPPLDPTVPEMIPRNWELKIPGEHNRENASLAAAALQALGLSEEEIRSGIESFEGVEGRLQLVREINGIKIYNDNNATTAEATIAALRALGDTIVLIAGGTDKGPDLNELVSEMKRVCKKVIFLAGTGTDKIKKEFPDAPIFDSLDGAVNEAIQSASKGDTILFSPAFASFGMFKNEYDRNDQFVKVINEL